MTSAYRRFLVPGVSTLVMLVVLLGLGTWQVYRLQWKERILAQIAAAEAAPAVPLRQDPAPYTKVFATGRFRFDQAAAFGAEVRDTRTGPTMGFYQIVPLVREEAPTVLVDRGWIPQKRELPLNDPTGAVTVTGYVRPREKQSWFSAADDEATRQFYTLDPQAIGAAVGVSGFGAVHSGRPGSVVGLRLTLLPRSICRGRRIITCPMLSPGMGWQCRWSSYLVFGFERHCGHDKSVRL